MAIAKSRVEPVEEIRERLQAALQHIDAERLLAAPDCGLAFSRHMNQQEVSFSAEAPYVPMEGTIPAFMNRGVEQSRRYRALPLYLSLMAYGRSGFQKLFEANCTFAQNLTSWIDGSDHFERLADTRLNIVCFRGIFDSDEANVRNRDLLKRINRSGKLFMTPTTYKGNFAYRLAASNWQTAPDNLTIVTKALSHAYRSLL